MTFVTRDAKKTCDSGRLEKREAVTEIRAAIEPVASWRMSSSPRGQDPGCEDTPTHPMDRSLEELPVLGLGFLLPAPAPQGRGKVEEVRRATRTEFSPRYSNTTQATGPRTTLSLSGPVSQCRAPGKLCPDCVDHIGAHRSGNYSLVTTPWEQDFTKVLEIPVRH